MKRLQKNARAVLACILCGILVCLCACNQQPENPTSDMSSGITENGSDITGTAGETEATGSGTDGTQATGDGTQAPGTGTPNAGGSTTTKKPNGGGGGNNPSDSPTTPTKPGTPTNPAPSGGTPIDSIANAKDPVNSTFFGSVEIEEKNTYTVPGGNGDLWPGAWSNDDYLYTANGDGPGFGSVNSDIAVSRLTGTPATGMSGQGLAHGDAVAKVWSGSQYNRKPTGMVSVGGVLYLAVQDLRSTKDGLFDDAPVASIYKSTDKGRTWTGTSSPMFTDYKFTTIMFLDYGKDNSNSPDGYVYAYGLDYNWRDSYSGKTTDPVNLYLARVPASSVQDRSKWEFFSGTTSTASWSKDINARKPVLTDTRRTYSRVTDNMPGVRDMSVISQGSVVYNPALKRYIYSSWTEYTYEFYESPTPYGPFKLFAQKDFGGYPWTNNKHGGYGCVIPSKFISSDGLSMYIVSTTFVSETNQYSYCMRKMKLTLAPTTKANNAKSNQNLARDSKLKPVVISRSNGNARPGRLNDGATDFFEQSWTGEAKDIDFWGYAFGKVCRFNTIEYTTGQMKNDGGWFSTLGVQVRKNGVWTNVSGGTVSPKYPKTAATGQYTTYTIRFNEIEGDAIRIIGKPGGSMRYTTIAELAVYYR